MKIIKGNIFSCEIENTSDNFHNCMYVYWKNNDIKIII